MATSEYRKAEIRSKNLKKKLDEIAAYRAKVRRVMQEPSSRMHARKEALKELGERSRKRT